MNTTAQALSAPFAHTLPNDRRHRAVDGLRRLLLGSVAFGSTLNQGRGSVPKPAPAGNRKMRRAAKLGAVSGVAAASLLLAGHAMANPTGGTVAAGNVTINASTPGTLNITQSTNSAIINWQSFNIGAGEKTNFLLPNASGVTLNRVTGTDPSSIFGTLSSNGTIFLVNPNGVFFGAHSKVDAAGIVATTANIGDQNFLAGKYDFSTPSTNLNASVVNEGEISIADRGLAALVAPSVRNSGVITAKLGRVALGGANSFTLDFWGDGLLSFNAGSTVTTAPKQADGSPVKALVTNSGKIVADGGTVELSARTVKSVVDQSINTDGIIEAKSIGTHDGNIVLGGGDAGLVEVAGTLDTSGKTAGSTGGTIEVAGAAIDLAATAKLDSSGAAGGGKIRVGTSTKGKTAASVTVAKGATVKADALTTGDGGAVSIVSDQSTVFAGTVMSRGGAQGGDGGAVEISGHNLLSLTGSVDLTAAKGKTGSLLIDPASIEITDNSSVSNTGNVVTRGWLETQSGSADITLSASGLITVDAMAGHLINLATGSGNSFTLQSTSTGGISFVDATTEIRTAGGSITLQAQGDGSLSNIGKLTSNGGAISLSATRNVVLAGAVNASTGAVTVKSTAGAITNPGANPITASAVSLQAVDGSIGTSSAPVTVATGSLSLATGGDIYAADTLALTNLSINSIHAVAPSNTYQLTAPNLTFSVTDLNSVYNLANVTATSPMAFSFTGDNGLSLGTISIGSGALALTSTNGNIVSAGPSSLLTAGSIALTASARSGGIGSLSTSAPINTQTGSLAVIAGTGGADIANTGVLALTSLNVTGASTVSTSGNLTIGAVSATGQAVGLTSTGGQILDDGDNSTLIRASTLVLQAAGAIGTTGNRLETTATNVSASNTSGDVDLNLTSGSAVTIASATTGNGSIDVLAAASTLTLTSAQVTGTNNVTVLDTAGTISVGTVITASGGTVTLTATSSLQRASVSTGNITASNIQLAAGSTGGITGLNLIGPSSGATSVTLSAGTAGIAVTTAASTATLANITSTGTIAVTGAIGNLALGTIASSGASTSTGAVTLTANAGAILASSPSVSGYSVALTAGSGSIGTSGGHVVVGTTALSLTSTGDIYVNDIKPLSQLRITDYHLTSAPNTLQLVAPYLTFAVTDDGSQMSLTNVTSANLSGGFSFTTDEQIKVGVIRMPNSSVGIATQNDGHALNPSIVDDGDPSTRITAASVSLSSAGGIGTAPAPVQVNSTVLSLVTGQDLYAQSIADLSTLAIQASHDTSTSNYTYQVTAPSLAFAVSDVAGYTLSNVSDVTGLNFTFRGDRATTVGTIDVSPIGTATSYTGISYATSGSVNLTAPNLIDDGNAATVITASSVGLNATSSGTIGSLAHRIGVVAESISSAGSTGLYLDIPIVANTTQHAVVLNGISATGPVDVVVDHGDAQLGTITATGTLGGITVATPDGSIQAFQAYAYNSSNFTFAYSDISNLTTSGLVSLTAAGAIGAHTQPINTSAPQIQATATSGGVYLTDTLAAQLNSILAGGAVEVTGSGALQATSIASGGAIKLAAGGIATLGAINAGSNAVTITGSAIQDTTGASLIGSAVTLTATSGAVGTSATPIAVTTPSLTATNSSGLFVDDSVALGTLALTFNGTNSASAIVAPGLTLTITPSGSNYFVQSVANGSNPLNFSFTSGAAIEVGAISTGGGSLALASTAGSITDDGDATTFITAPSVSLSAAGSIGDAVNAITLSGTSALTLKTGGNIYVAGDTELTSLAITETSGSQTAAVFNIVTADDTIAITDDGTTAYQDYLQTVSGNALTDFSFTGVKNLEIGAIAASNSVSLTTANGGTHGNVIAMDGMGGSAITAPTINLTATSGTAGQAAIGTSGTHIAVTGSGLSLTSSGNVYVSDTSALTSLALAVNHPGGTSSSPDTTNYSYAVSAPHLSFGITDGSTATITALSDTIESLAFAFTTDRALAIGGTIHVGATAGAGSVALTSTTGSITKSSGTVTAGAVSLSATAGNASIGTGGTAITVATPNLTVATGANLYVSDSATLTNLAITTTHPTFSSSGNESWTYSLTLAGGQSVAITDPFQQSIGINYSQTPTTVISSVTSTTDLAFSLTSDRNIEVETINVGAGGSVSLTANNAGIYNDLNTATRITANSLTLYANTIGTKTLPGSDQNLELDTTVNTLTATAVGNTITSVVPEAGIYVINTGDLAIGAVTARTTADIKSLTGSLTEGTGSPGITATNVVLSAATGSIGTNSGSIDTTAKYLSLTSGDNIYVANAVGLDSLVVHSTHQSVGAEIFQIASPGLVLNIGDTGTLYTLGNPTAIGNARGLDFTFSGDKDVQIGNIVAGPGRGISITSTGNLTDDTSSLIGETVTLVAGGSIATSVNQINTTTTNLSITTGGDAFVSNSLDLATLNFRSTQSPGTGATYSVTAPQLTFAVTTDGTTTSVIDVADATGINLGLSTVEPMAVGTINAQSSGTVSLNSFGNITGIDGTNDIIAASVGLTDASAPSGSFAGTSGTPINLTAPQVTLNLIAGGAINDSLHIDNLSVTGYSSSAASFSLAVAGPGAQSFSFDHDATGYTDLDANDTVGMGLTFSTLSQNVSVGSINLGTNGNVLLDARGNLTQGAGTGITAATVNLDATGAIGSVGTPMTVNSATYGAEAVGGGVFSNLTSPSTIITGITALGGDIGLGITGDITLGSIDADGHNFTATAIAGGGTPGSILSGSISRATTITLTAAGGIGTLTAISTGGFSTGGTTTVIAHAAGGGVAITDGDNLVASNVTAVGGAISLYGATSLTVGTITATGQAVSLSGGTGVSGGGSIIGQGGNIVTGSSVSLTAGAAGNGSIGTNSQAINVATQVLTVADPQNVYVSDSLNLTDLTISRSTNNAGNEVGGTLSLISTAGGTPFHFSGTDDGSNLTLTTVTDSSALNLTVRAHDTIRIGTVNLTSGGTAILGTDGVNASIVNINGSSQLTAGTATLTAGSSASSIGTGGSALGLAVGTLNATAGTAGIYLTQAGDLSLSSIASGGDLSVADTSGDLTVGALSYGSGAALTLTASAGRILNGNPLGTAIVGTTGTITLSASDGIGTSLLPLSLTTGTGAVSLTDTGTGNIYVSSAGGIAGGLTVATNNGSANLTLGAASTLNSATSTTDATGNDINVTVSSGNLTVGTVTAGGNFDAVRLTATGGSILGAGGSTIAADAVYFNAAGNIGTSGASFALTTPQIFATTTNSVGSNNGIYLNTSGTTVLADLASNGAKITVIGSGELFAALVGSSGGVIDLEANGTGTNLIAGAIGAGTGAVILKANGAILDDDLATTRVAGNAVTLNSVTGIGTDAQSVQTTATSLTATATDAAATGIFIDDNNTAGVTLSSIVAKNGAIGITTAGATIATTVTEQTDATGNDISIVASSGNLTVGSVTAGTTTNAVTLGATAGAILSGSGAANVTAHDATLSAATGIGSLTNVLTGAGTPIKLAVTTIDGLTTTGANSVISVSETGAMTLGANALSLAAGGSAYLSATGDLDASAGLTVPGDGSLALVSGGTLTLPTTAFSTTGTLYLSGTTDVVLGGGGREITETAGSLKFRSGSAGGATTLDTTAGAINAALTGTQDLTVANSGTLSALTLQGGGNVTFTNDVGFTANSVIAGSGKTIDLTATTGTLSATTLNAGSTGTVDLTATAGAIGGGTTVTAGTLNLVAATAIGTIATPFQLNIANFSAQVTGTGDIHIQDTGAITLGTTTTHDGNITITAAGNIAASSPITAGNGGNIALTSTGGNLALTGTITTTGTDATKGNLALSGLTVTVGSVTTVGSQSYTGATTIGGNLTGAGILVTGNATLTGTDAFDTGATNGNIQVTGTLAGGGHGLTLTAGTGNIILGGAATGLTTLVASGGQLTLAGVTTTNAQTYTAPATLDGAFVITGAGAFTSNGPTTLSGATTVTTVNGAVTFASTLDGGNALTVNAGSSDISLDGAIGGTTRLGALALNSTGATNLGSAVKAASVTTNAGGTLAIDGGLIDTTGAQSYGEATTLGADTVLNATTASFGSTLDGASALTVNGNALFGSAVGATTALHSVAVTGAAAIDGGAITTTGAQGYGNGSTLGTDTTLTANLVTFGTLDAAGAGQQSLTVAGNALFGGAVGGTKALKSLAVSGTSTIDNNIATSGAQTYAGAVTLGGDAVLATGNGAVGFGATIDGAQALTITSGSGAVSVAGAVGGTTRLGALTVDSNGATTFGGAIKAASVTTDAGGTLALNGGLVDTTGAQSYGEATTLGTDTVLNATTASFGGTLDGAAALTVDGNAVFGVVGGTTALKSIIVSGAAAIDGAAITTTGGQSYGNGTVIGANATLTGTLVTFGTLDDATAGQQSLTVAGNALFGGTVGGNAALKAIAVSGTSTIDADVTTIGSQSYAGAVLLASDPVLTTTNAAISFGSSLNGTELLTIRTGTGNVTFAGTIGDTARLGDLTVDSSGATLFGGSVKAASVTTDAGGTLAINGGLVDTTGAQSYGEAATLGADTVLNATTASFAGTVDGSATGQQGLTVNANALFGSAVGGAKALKALAVAGTSTIDANVTTTGDQLYTGVVTLGGDAVMTSANGAVDFAASLDGAHALTIDGTGEFGAAVGGKVALTSLTITGDATIEGNVTTTGMQSFDGSVELSNLDVTFATTNAAITFGSTIDGANAVTVATGTGDVTFAGAVGGTTRLAALTVDSSGATTFAGSVKAASVTTDAGGTLAINGGLVDTSGAQHYGEAATLGADTTLNATTVAFGGTLDGANALTIDGNATLGGAAALKSLAISGTSSIDANIATVGAQTYTGAVTLGSDATLTASSGPVLFASTLDGTHALTIAGSSVTFTNAVGGSARLGALTVNTSGATTFGGTVKAASVTTDAGGTVAINGGLVDTTGAQSYGEAATLGADTTLNATNASFGGTLDGAGTLIVNGNASFGAGVGATQALKSIAVGGAATFKGPSVTTSGTQSYGTGSLLAADNTLNATLVTFNGSLDGSQNLVIAGNAAFDGAVGATAALKTVSVSGTTSLDSAAITTAGNQSYGAAVTVGGNSSLLSQTGSLGFASTIDAVNRGGLTLSAVNGNITVPGAVGSTGPLGALTVATVKNVTFGGAINAASLAVTASGTPQLLGALFTDGTGGITLTGNSFTLLNPITATAGALTVNLGTNGTLVVGPNALVNTATGFTQTQTGPSTISLASNITSKTGPISFQGSPTLIGSALTFQTNGLIRFAGLSGASTDLTLIAGPTGSIVAGQANTLDTSKLAILKSLTVPLGGTGTATIYGTLGGDSGVLPSSEVKSPLRGALYTYNTYPWGPLNLIGTITVTVPTTNPESNTNTGLQPNMLDAGQAPSLLTVNGNNDLLGTGQSPDLLNSGSTAGASSVVFGTSQPQDSTSSSDSASPPKPAN